MCGKQGKTLENSVQAFENRRLAGTQRIDSDVHVHIDIDIDIDVVPRDVERELKNRI